jgi:hypothetical protein
MTVHFVREMWLKPLRIQHAPATTFCCGCGFPHPQRQPTSTPALAKRRVLPMSAFDSGTCACVRFVSVRELAINVQCDRVCARAGSSLDSQLFEERPSTDDDPLDEPGNDTTVGLGPGPAPTPAPVSTTSTTITSPQAPAVVVASATAGASSALSWTHACVKCNSYDPSVRRHLLVVCPHSMCALCLAKQCEQPSFECVQCLALCPAARHSWHVSYVVSCSQVSEVSSEGGGAAAARRRVPA